MHRLGTASHDMGPLDGSGSVLRGVCIQCEKCHERFMMKWQGMFMLGASIYDLKSRLSVCEIWCPYCGHKSYAEASSTRLSDTRPSYGDDY